VNAPDLAGVVAHIPGGIGSPEWRAHRLTHWNASDAPAMMGVEGAHETRTELLDRLHSGVDRIFSDWVQDNIIDPGHTYERLGRERVEYLLDDVLVPMVFVKGRYSASLDGRRLCGMDWEHKRLNQVLREAFPRQQFGDPGEPGNTPVVRNELVPMLYRVQIAHQQLCSGAKETLLSATDWDGTKLLDERHYIVPRDDEMIEKVAAGWIQFDRDLQAHIPQPRVERARAAPVEMLPTPVVQCTGAVALTHNLLLLTDPLREFVARMSKAPSNDQEFADLAAQCKRLGELEKATAAAVDQALASVGDVDAMRQAGATLVQIAREARLAGEKLGESHRLKLRSDEITRGRDAVAAHLARSVVDVWGVRVQPTFAPVDFAQLLKGMSSINAMRDKISTAIAGAKIVIDADRDAIVENLGVLNAVAEDMRHLFKPDVAALVMRDREALTLIIDKRISDERVRLDAVAQKARADERAVIESTPAPTPAPAPHAQESGYVPGTPGLFAGNAATAAAAAPSGSEGGRAQADLSAFPPVRLADICDKLGWRMTAAEVQALGVNPFKPEGKSVTLMLHAADLPKLKAALLARVAEAL